MIHLNEDVLLNILLFCDLNTIISFGRTCKKFQQSLRERPVWANAIQNLHDRGFIDLYPGQSIEQLSRDELINLAKRSNRGPTTWKKDSDPEISRSYTMEFDEPSDAYGGLNSQEAILVPGGQYVVFRSHKGDRLVCWELATSNIIWTSRPHQEGCSYRSMVVDVVRTDDGPVIGILVVFSRYISLNHPWEYSLQYMRLNPRMKAEEVIFIERLASTPSKYPLGKLILSGDYAISYVGKELTIYNQITRTFTRHNLSSSRLHYKLDIGLAKNHLLVIRKSGAPTYFNMKLYDIQTLQQEAASSKTLLKVDAQTEQWAADIELFPEALEDRDKRSPGQRDRIYYEISCHPSPLRDNIWCIWVLVSAIDCLSSCGRLWKYHVEYADDGSISSVQPASSIGPIKEYALPTWTGGITWAGFAQLYYVEKTLLYMFEEAGQPNVDLCLCLPVYGCAEIVSLSRYSGAITYAAETEVVVNHYK